MTTQTFKLVNGKPEIEITRGAHLDYLENWTDWLSEASTPADTLDDVTWDVSTGLTNEGESFTAGGVARVNLFCPLTSVVGSLQHATCRITSAATPPRIDSRTIYLRVVDR